MSSTVNLGAAAPAGVATTVGAIAQVLPGDIVAALFAGGAPPFQQVLAAANSTALDTPVVPTSEAPIDAVTAESAALSPRESAPLTPLGDFAQWLEQWVPANDAAVPLASPVTDDAEPLAVSVSDNSAPLPAPLLTPRAAKPARSQRDDATIAADAAAAASMLAPPPLAVTLQTPVVADTAAAATSGTTANSLLPAIQHAVARADTASAATQVDGAAGDTVQLPAEFQAGEELPGRNQDQGGDSRPGDQQIWATRVVARATGDTAATLATAAVLLAPDTAAATAQRAATVEHSISVPMSHPQWSQAVAAEVRWCADNQVQSATLKLSPEHLGPVEINVELKDSQVNVTFGASHADTRAALEATLPRLRELLAGAGLSLGQATVQQETRRESQNPLPGLRGAADEPVATVQQRVTALGLVDEYA